MTRAVRTELPWVHVPKKIKPLSSRTRRGAGGEESILFHVELARLDAFDKGNPLAAREPQCSLRTIL